MFGGNSNWRGPVWMPVNALIVRALLNLYAFYGDEFTVECPTGSGRRMTLFEVAKEITRPAHAARSCATARPAAGLRRDDEVPGRSALARPDPVLRVLPRRQRRAGGAPPNGRGGLVAPLLDFFGRMGRRTGRGAGGRARRGAERGGGGGGERARRGGRPRRGGPPRRRRPAGGCRVPGPPRAAAVLGWRRTGRIPPHSEVGGDPFFAAV